MKAAALFGQENKTHGAIGREGLLKQIAQHRWESHPEQRNTGATSSATVLLLCSPGRAAQAPNSSASTSHPILKDLLLLSLLHPTLLLCQHAQPPLSLHNSLPGSSLQLQDEPFITNQLLELHFPWFQQLHHSKTHGMGYFLKTNLKGEETLPRKTS